MADLTLVCLLLKITIFSTPLKVLTIFLIRLFSPWFLDWKGKTKATFLCLLNSVPKHVVIISSDVIFNELLWGDFFYSLSQSVQTFRIKRFEASAEISLFKMVWFEVLCLLRIHFSQVFVMRSIDWDFLIGFQLIVL